MAALELHDYSVLGHGNGEPRTYRREDLFVALWKRLNTVVASTVR
jgi:hypothetical protein